jgi:hypothetical protein
MQYFGKGTLAVLNTRKTYNAVRIDDSIATIPSSGESNKTLK